MHNSAVTENDPIAMDRINLLMREHQRRLYRFVSRSVGNRSDAEDITQQAFTEAYRSMRTFRGESELSTWLYGIAMNLVRNYLNRSPHRLYAFESSEVLDTLPHDGSEPDICLQRTEIAGLLGEVLANMSDELRETFVLVGLREYSYDEAAAALSVPIGTVRSRIFRARGLIQTALPDLRNALAA